MTQSDVGNFTSLLEQSLERVNISKNMVVILGDFNATSPTWTCGVDQYNTAGKSLEPLALRYNLKQCVDFPTHIRHDGSLGSTLDLCFTNNVQAIRKVTSLPPLGQSDHTMVGCSIDLSPVKSQPVHPKRRVFLYDNVDLALVNEELSAINWSGISAASSIDTAWHRWKSLFFSVVDKHIPSKLVGAPKNKPPWLDKPLKVQIRQKHLAWKEYKRTRSVESLSNFRLIRNKVTKSLRLAEKQYLLSLHRNTRNTHSPTSARHFWNHIKLLTGQHRKATIPDLQTTNPDGTTNVFSDDQAKADLLNAFFAQQTNLADVPLTLPDLSNFYTDEHVADSLSTSSTEVFDTLVKLKAGKAPGKDSITPELLSKCASGIANSLSLLFNRSFSECRIPRD